ncbi:hypothetical protein [uncultured Erythrobacter sp.]|uniref:hypothetical protein n=1 Tax=uncultured Erythrobacter sp. TaxID=263913 RepID=UPI00262EFBE9|nr:hypothetical protein [uncultured Erythrobacter sp.]
MDWAIISKTLTRLETLVPDEAAAELALLGREDPALFERVEGLRATANVAQSFMQTSMPDAGVHQTGSMQPADRIDIWKINALLGAGGIGEVYEASLADA